MGRIVRELRTLPGAIVGFLIIAIVSFWVLNLLQTRTPAPVSTFAGWAASRASGDAYAGGYAPAAPAVATSPYSYSNNGPYI